MNIIKYSFKLVIITLALSSVMAFAEESDDDKDDSPPPTASIISTPNTVSYGTKATISWSSERTSSCKASDGLISDNWADTKPISGSFITSELTQNTTYTITCANKNGTQVTTTTKIKVKPPAGPKPSIQFSGSPTSVVYQGTTTLKWSATYTNSCSATGGWSGSRTTSGQITLSNLLSKTTYSLTCIGTGGTTTQSITINVSSPLLPIVSINATPASINYGDTTTLTWTSTYANSCIASSGWTGNQPLSGSFVTPSLSSPTLYSLTCTGPSGSTAKSITIGVTPPPAPTISLSASPSTINSGDTTTLTWTSTYANSCIASSGWTGNQSLLGTFVTPKLSSPTLYTLTCTGPGGTVTQSTNINVAPPTSNAGSKMGINLSFVSDWGDRDLKFVDVMKIARGFATLQTPWDPDHFPAPTDANGWPTTDFGIVFISYPNDPLNRPLSATFPSMIGTYKLSFTGQATVNGYNCCQVINKVYNAATNTTTADVVVGPTDPYVFLTFTNTQNGVQNLKLLRPGYPLGTTQVFTNEFLNAVAPFSTLRFMEPLSTNNSHGSLWNARKLKSDPTQNDMRGIAWEYVIDIANATNKDIWINIPDQINLDDPTANNYVIQLATLIKNSLHDGIHVYVEYSNETWNTVFPQTQANTAAAVAEVNSGADTTLNYDNANNQWYWGYRRAAHQTLKISQLFAEVFGPAAINTIIRPVYMSQYVQPFIMEDVLRYLNTNFGAPSTYLYGIGGAPYFSPQTSFTDATSLLSSLQAGLNQINHDAAPLPAYNGGVVWTGITQKSIANYYGLKTLMYEGGPDLSNNPNMALIEQTAATPEMAMLAKAELTHFLSCDNDLFVYYKLSAPAGDSPWGIYEDVALPTEKSKMFIDLAATPLTNFTNCN